MIDLKKQNILGICIDAADYEMAVRKIMDAASSTQPLSVSALAVHGVMTGVLDAYHRYRLNHLDLALPDGQPVRWALKWLHGLYLPERVYGPQLMLEVCRQAAEKKLPIFLFGTTEQVLADLRRNLKRRFPALRIAGSQCSRFRRLTPAEKKKLIRKIRNSGAAITFVGLGCPRQEVWIYEHRQSLSMPLLAVGAAFAFHAGRLPQAPEYLQKCGLEWFYRLSKEPRHLWKRYLFLNPLYLVLLFFQLTRLVRFDSKMIIRPKKELRYG